MWRKVTYTYNNYVKKGEVVWKKKKFLSSVYLIIRNKNNDILLQRRQGTKLWPGFLALPAGHVDEGENAYDAIIREAKEELGIEILLENIIDTFVVNRRNKSLSPYYDVYFEVSSYKGNIKINEPEKCSELVWNYNKFNRLIEELLFMGDEKLDFYLLRKVIEFFKKEKQDNNLISDIKILQKYFDSELSVKESINKFVKEYIKIDDNERKLIISLCKKRNRI